MWRKLCCVYKLIWMVYFGEINWLVTYSGTLSKKENGNKWVVQASLYFGHLVIFEKKHFAEIWASEILRQFSCSTYIHNVKYQMARAFGFWISTHIINARLLTRASMILPHGFMLKANLISPFKNSYSCYFTNK